MSDKDSTVSLHPALAMPIRTAADPDHATAIRQGPRNAALGVALSEILREEGWTQEELLQEDSKPSRGKRSA